MKKKLLCCCLLAASFIGSSRAAGVVTTLVSLYPVITAGYKAFDTVHSLYTGGKNALAVWEKLQDFWVTTIGDNYSIGVKNTMEYTNGLIKEMITVLDNSGLDKVLEGEFAKEIKSLFISNMQIGLCVLQVHQELTNKNKDNLPVLGQQLIERGKAAAFAVGMTGFAKFFKNIKDPTKPEYQIFHRQELFGTLKRKMFLEELIKNVAMCLANFINKIDVSLENFKGDFVLVQEKDNKIFFDLQNVFLPLGTAVSYPKYDKEFTEKLDNRQNPLIHVREREDQAGQDRVIVNASSVILVFSHFVESVIDSLLINGNIVNVQKPNAKSSEDFSDKTPTLIALLEEKHSRCISRGLAPYNLMGYALKNAVIEYPQSQENQETQQTQQTQPSQQTQQSQQSQQSQQRINIFGEDLLINKDYKQRENDILEPYVKKMFEFLVCDQQGLLAMKNNIKTTLAVFERENQFQLPDLENMITELPIFSPNWSDISIKKDSFAKDFKAKTEEVMLAHFNETGISLRTQTRNLKSKLDKLKIPEWVDKLLDIAQIRRARDEVFRSDYQSEHPSSARLPILPAEFAVPLLSNRDTYGGKDSSGFYQSDVRSNECNHLYIFDYYLLNNCIEDFYGEKTKDQFERDLGSIMSHVSNAQLSKKYQALERLDHIVQIFRSQAPMNIIGVDNITTLRSFLYNKKSQNPTTKLDPKFDQNIGYDQGALIKTIFPELTKKAKK